LNRLNNNKGCGIRFLLYAAVFSFIARVVRGNYRLAVTSAPQASSEKADYSIVAGAV